MADIIVFSRNKNQAKKLGKLLPQHNLTAFSDEEKLSAYLQTGSADLVLVDTVGLEDAVNICRSIKFNASYKNIPNIQIVSKRQEHKDFLKFSSAYVSSPVDKDILNATIYSMLQTKSSIDELSENNSALSANSYRLDNINKTITALAGSLDKTELIEILTNGIEKILSFQLCYSLVFIDPTNITLSIHSLRPVSERLEEAIKLRAILIYKDLFNIQTTNEEIKVIKKIKRTNDVEYDEYLFDKLKFDTVLAPINVNNKFFGIIEVFREKEFETQDTNEFQALVKQVTFPLQRALLFEEIKEKNDQLLELEKKKSEFFTIVSHEIKTPLTSIRNAVKILQGNSFPEIPERAKWFIKMIDRNSVRLFSIIQDWLDSAKAEAGKLDYNFTLANINPLVDAVVQNLSNLADEKNIHFSVSKTEKLPALYIDTKRIEQVITNLVSNALKYTPNGGKITVTTEINDATKIKEKPIYNNKDILLSDEYIVVKVSDTGPGIAKEDIEKVFEKFEQVQGTLSRSVGGTGLGLFIAKQFADVHNGFLWLESEVGQGADFYLAIPVLTEEERFAMQLRHDITNADNEKRSIGLITLCENKINDKPYLMEFIKKLDVENVFKRTTASKQFYAETKEKLYYYFYDINMNTQIFNFVVQRIIEFAQKDEIIKKGKKIYLSQIYYPEEASDSEELLKKSKRTLKEVING